MSCSDEKRIVNTPELIDPLDDIQDDVESLIEGLSLKERAALLQRLSGSQPSSQTELKLNSNISLQSNSQSTHLPKSNNTAETHYLTPTLPLSAISRSVMTNGQTSTPSIVFMGRHYGLSLSPRVARHSAVPIQSPVLQSQFPQSTLASPVPPVISQNIPMPKLTPQPTTTQ